jgi:nicotinamide-nucleotide amidase
MSDIETLALSILQMCRDDGIMLVAAESCTGGMIAVALTGISGSSDVFDRGFVTYSNEAKMEMLGVTSQTLEEFGAVSREAAISMAEGALLNSRASIAIAVTGIAGPAGGSTEKPVGTVWFATSYQGKAFATGKLFPDKGREFIRQEACRTALELVRERLLSA